MDTLLVARSIIVWGTLEIGTQSAPIPANVTAGVRFWGDDKSQTVVVTDGLFVTNKVLVVMGTLRVAGTAVGGTRKAWTKLAATAEKNSSQLVIRGDVSWWPTGSLVGIGATEYPDTQHNTTQTEVRRVVNKPVFDTQTNTTRISLNSTLSYRHFSGPSRPPASSDFPLFPSICSSLPLLFGRSNMGVNLPSCVRRGYRIHV